MPLTRNLPLAAFAFVCPLLALSAAAQLTAGKIIFRNPGPFAQKDLETASEMHPGAKVANGTLQAAAQKLMDTGYFDDVGVEVEGPSAALNVTYILKPVDSSKLIATGFENLVWLTPEDIAATLHTTAPLFHGKLPEAGNQPDAITAALQAALTAKGITAAVAHETLEPSLTQPVRAVEFRVDRPIVRLNSVQLQGIAPELADAETKLATRLRGSRYNEGLLGENTAAMLLQPYRDAGFLDAHLTGVNRTVAQSTPTEVTVDLTASVTSGQPYKVSCITFAGTPLIPQNAVMAAVKLHPGDIASNQLLLESIAPIDAAYRKQGYMDIFVDPGTRLDTTAQTVSYTLTVIPGEQYRLRSVTPLNLSGEALKDFNTGWRMKPGDLYNADYVANFLKNNTALRSLEGYTAAFKASANPQTHEVDLTITFVRMGTR